MTDFDIIIIGAGPAGMSAALTAANGGLDVLLLDEQPHAGGQIYRNVKQNHSKQSWFGKSYSSGINLVDALNHIKITKCFGATVWRVEANKRVLWSQNGESKVSTAVHIVLANGAQERPFPFPGWTLPGVMTIGSAQILMKSSGIFPKDSVLVGSGPLLYLVATQMIEANCPPKALLETQTLRMMINSLIHLPKALLNMKSLIMGFIFIYKIKSAGVPRYKSVSRLEAQSSGNGSIKFLFSHKGIRKSLTTKLLLIHQGVIPSTEISRSVGVDHSWNTSQLAFQPIIDKWGKTNIDGLYIAGDCGGINGSEAAVLYGKIVATKILYETGKINFNLYKKQSFSISFSLFFTNSIRLFLDTLFAVPQETLSPSDETIVCRCEEKTVGEIKLGLNEGITGVRQLKTSIRSGMGQCQGRMCDAIVRGIMLNNISQNDINILAPKARSPIKPITLGELSKMKLD